MASGASAESVRISGEKGFGRLQRMPKYHKKLATLLQKQALEMKRIESGKRFKKF